MVKWCIWRFVGKRIINKADIKLLWLKIIPNTKRQTCKAICNIGNCKYQCHSVWLFVLEEVVQFLRTQYSMRHIGDTQFAKKMYSIQKIKQYFENLRKFRLSH